MVGPGILARMEKPGNKATVRVQSCQIGALVAVAEQACHGQIVQIISAPMLSGGDVFKLERNKGLMLLFEQAVFATSLCTLPDFQAEVPAHALCRSSLR